MREGEKTMHPKLSSDPKPPTAILAPKPEALIPKAYLAHKPIQSPKPPTPEPLNPYIPGDPKT